MEQTKIGNFIRELRKEKNLTQEQLAEVFRVSRRTVSRWETGSNLPDLDILIEMTDYFGVELRELIDGERKSDKMEKELEKTVIKAADYSSNIMKEKINARMHILFIAGMIAAIIYLVLTFTDCADNFFGGLCHGIMTGMMVVGVFMTSKNAARISEFKLRLLNEFKLRLLNKKNK